MGALVAGLVLGASLMLALRPTAEPPAATPGQPILSKVAVDRPGCPPSVACPPNHCPEPSCEPAVVVVEEPAACADPRFETVTPNLVTSALMGVTRDLGVQGAFVIDCDSYPCVARFDGNELPSMEDRAVIANALTQSLPTQAHVANHTHFGQQGKVTWGLFVGEGKLTGPESAAALDRLTMAEDEGSMNE